MFNFPKARRSLREPGALRRNFFDAVWRPQRLGKLGEKPPRSHRYRFCFLENGTLSERFRVFRSLVIPRREWVAGFFERPCNPWLRARFTVLAFRYKLESPAENGENAGVKAD